MRADLGRRCVTTGPLRTGHGSPEECAGHKLVAEARAQAVGPEERFVLPLHPIPHCDVCTLRNTREFQLPLGSNLLLAQEAVSPSTYASELPTVHLAPSFSRRPEEGVGRLTV